MNEKNTKDMIVVGAGIAGLTAGYIAQKIGLQPLIFEGGDRVGGVIRSEWKNEYLLEFGPNTVQLNKTLVDFIAELDLNHQIRIADAKTPRFIQKNGRLHPIPLSPGSLIKTSLLSFKAKLALLKEPWIPPQNNEEENISGFFSRRFGSEVADFLAAPFVSGVWAGNPNSLSITSAFPKLAEWETHWGSVLKGLKKNIKTKPNSEKKIPKGLLSFKKGLTQLTDALSQKMGDKLFLNEPVIQIQPEQSAGRNLWVVSTAKRKITSQKIILASPPHMTAPLISPFCPEAAQALTEIPFAPIAILHLSVKTSDLPTPITGFGYLVAPSEKSEILGCLFSSSLFSDRAPAGMSLLTVFMGGAMNPDQLTLNDENLLNKAKSSLQPILKWTTGPEVLAITRYSNAIPQYTLGHSKRMEKIKMAQKKWPGLYLVGNFDGGIAVGNVVENAQRKTLEAAGKLKTGAI